MADFKGHTPGPWGWFGDNSHIYLATPDRGRIFVMGFERMGMQAAQPNFGRRGVMCPASEMVEMAVGNPDVRGFKAAKADPSVYRYDIKGIDHPNAHLIASAPTLLAESERLRALVGEMVEALETITSATEGSEGDGEDQYHAMLFAIEMTAEATIAKAREALK